MVKTYVKAYPGALRRAMDDAGGLSLREVAEPAGLAKQTVANQVNGGDFTIELQKAKRIADVVGVPVSDLFCYPLGDPIGVGL